MRSTAWGLWAVLLWAVAVGPVGAQAVAEPEAEPLVGESAAEGEGPDLLGVDELFFERGGASWYGIGLHRRRTASGERFDMNAYTAAHRTLPFGTRVCVHSLVTGREVLVRINDRGPHTAGRIIDLSRAAAAALGLLDLGIKQVALSLPERTGRPCGG